ncbi:MAG: aldehyde dehydrogenase family protein [Myxococcota bacterium]|nr:aldehyde dehydrogenase family protein [Myxococcota bacterium]
MSIFERLGIGTRHAGTCLGPGRWLENPESPWIESINPATGDVIGRVRASTAEELSALMETAQSARLDWAKVPAPRRGEAVRLIGQALRRHKTDLGRLVALEMGKIKEEGEGEVQEMIDIADFAVGQSRMLYGKTMPSERPDHRMYEQWHPLGLVGVITAFNFPVAVWAWNACISAICGNVTIWKPSPKTPFCAVAIQKICNDVLRDNELPPVFMLFNDAGVDLAEMFVADQRLGLTSFTGSTRVGRKVACTVASRLGKYLLELGGNNALIVDETADLDLAIPAIVFGAVGTAGQRCTTTRRLFVHESCYEVVKKRLVTGYGGIRVGDPLADGTLMGPLIDELAVERFENTIIEACRQGGTVLHGGKKIDRAGYFVEPTLIAIDAHAPIVQDETFAPILYVHSFSTLDEAISGNNQVAQGLSSALFTRELRRGEQFLSALGSDCGIANINIGTSGAEIGGAFGGEKDTGGGREAGSDAWQAYMRRQTNTINWSNALPLAQGINFDV